MNRALWQNSTQFGQSHGLEQQHRHLSSTFKLGEVRNSYQPKRICFAVGIRKKKSGPIIMER